MLFAAALAGGCDVGAPDADHPSRGLNQPLVRVIGAEVTTSYDGAGNPVRSALVEGEILEGVPTSASVRLFFSRFLLPTSVIRQSVCLHPTTETINSIADCREPFQPFERPQYSPTDRAVSYRMLEGARLNADTQYRLTVFASESADDTAVFAFDGAPLDRVYTFEFRTQADDATAQDENPPTPDGYCAIVNCGSACTDTRNACSQACIDTLTTCSDACMGDGTCEDACDADFDACDQPCADAETTCNASCPCFEPSCAIQGDLVANSLFGSCAFGQCHAASTETGEDIAMGLNLATPALIEATAINMTAHQTQMGEESVVGDQSPLRFGRAMPLIDPGNPGNSYLLYKVLANDLSFLTSTSIEDAVNLDVGLLEEIDRLRASVVVGLPMPAQPASGPPQGFVFVDGLSSFEATKLLEYWIAAGAVTSCE